MKPCRERIPFEKLVAWYANELDDADADALEAHLFACDECAAAAEQLAPLIGGLRELVPPVITHAFHEKLVAAGQRILVTPCAPDGTATARFAPDLDLLVHALRGDFSKAEQVDFEVVRPDGAVGMAFEHVPFDAKTGEVLVACQRHYRNLFPEGAQPTFRLHVTEAGKKRRLADYLVVHIWE